MRLLATVAALLFATACVPWTVRPIDSVDAEKSKAELSAPAYVDAIWTSKLKPAIAAQAIDAADLRKSTPLTRSLRAVKGSGALIRIDTASKAGLAYIDLAPFDGKPDLTLQIGPVMRGVALRDVTTLIPFSDFTNQLRYADVAIELNERAKAQLSTAGLGPATPKGATIQFLGAVEVEPESNPPLRNLVAIEIGVKP